MSQRPVTPVNGEGLACHKIEADLELAQQEGFGRWPCLVVLVCGLESAGQQAIGASTNTLLGTGARGRCQEGQRQQRSRQRLAHDAWDD